MLSKSSNMNDTNEREKQSTKGLVTLVKKKLDLDIYNFPIGEQIDVEMREDQEMRTSQVYYSIVYAPKYRIGETGKLDEKHESFYTIFKYDPFIGSIFPRVSCELPLRNPHLVEVGREEVLNPLLNRSQQRLHMHALEHAWNMWRIPSDENNRGRFVDTTGIVYDVKRELSDVTFMQDFIDKFYSPTDKQSEGKTT